MQNDVQIQGHILDELKWEPSVDAAEIGVTVEDGVVTLTGRVPTYEEKLVAERASQRVAGVRAVANDLEVRPSGTGERTDADIARAAAEALAWCSSVPPGRVKVAVSEGWVTLEGEVDWQYQREFAHDAIRPLLGVRGVINDLRVRPKASATEVKANIEAAFRRSAEVDADKVRVEVLGSKITLGGNVRSWSERQEAERTVWAAPGVSSVENRIAVVPYVTAYSED
jgi:osmotically-inducible protein OsmY